jgi:hypothetical protein
VQVQPKHTLVNPQLHKPKLLLQKRLFPLLKEVQLQVGSNCFIFGNGLPAPVFFSVEIVCACFNSNILLLIETWRCITFQCFSIFVANRIAVDKAMCVTLPIAQATLRCSGTILFYEWRKGNQFLFSGEHHSTEKAEFRTSVQASTSAPVLH